MPHVFISYSRRDKDYVVELAQYLERAGIAVFYDSNIGYSAQWWTTIVKHVTDCAAMIVVMTPALDTSEWVMKEVLLARRADKPVFPLLLEGEGYPLLIDVQHLDVTSRAMPGPDFVNALRNALGLDGPAPRPSAGSTEVVGNRVAVQSELDLDALAAKVERANETLEAWERLVPARARTAPMLMMKARALDDLLEAEQCLTVCDAVLGIDPGHLDATVLKARQLAQLGYLDGAIALLSSVVEQHPGHVDALVAHADASNDMDLDGGEALVDRALAFDPDDAAGLAVKAMYFRQRRDALAAARLIERAAAIDPGSVEVCLGRVSNNSRRGDYKQAIEDIEALIRVFPHTPILRILLAVTKGEQLVTLDDLDAAEYRRLEGQIHGLIAMGSEWDVPAGRVVAGLGHFFLAAKHYRQGFIAVAESELATATDLIGDIVPSITRMLAEARQEFAGLRPAAATPALLAVLTRFSGADYHVAPNIPPAKLSNARAACRLDPDAIVLALIDCTSSGSATDCIVFTETFAAQFHSVLSGTQRTKLPYATLTTNQYLARGSDVVNPVTGLFWFITEGSSVGAVRVVEILDAVKAHLAGPG